MRCAGKASQLKEQVKAGKLDAGVVLDDAVSTFKQQVSMRAERLLFCNTSPAICWCSACLP